MSEDMAKEPDVRASIAELRIRHEPRQQIRHHRRDYKHKDGGQRKGQDDRRVIGDSQLGHDGRLARWR